VDQCFEDQGFQGLDDGQPGAAAAAAAAGGRRRGRWEVELLEVLVDSEALEQLWAKLQPGNTLHLKTQVIVWVCVCWGRGGGCKPAVRWGGGGAAWRSRAHQCLIVHAALDSPHSHSVLVDYEGMPCPTV
jgi:hypothetical protein